MEINMEDNLFYFRNYIIKDLVDRGYKYIARDKDGTIYAFSCQPIKRGEAWGFDMTSNDDKMEDISVVSALFYNVKWQDRVPSRITYAELDDKSKRFYGVIKDNNND